MTDLQNACDIADYGESDSSLEDLLDQWDDLDLEQNAWLVFSPAEELAGYAAVDIADKFFCDFFTRPTPEKPLISRYLLAQCEERALALLDENPSAAGATAATIIPHVNLIDRQAAEAAGFRPHHYHFRMQIEMDAPPAPPAWPANLTLRTIDPAQEDRLVYDFIQAAFERPGRTPPSFQQWRDFMMRPDHFISELWFLAFAGDELVGAALCFDDPQYGWVRQLGVAQNWRKRGLGTALLQHVFGVFRQRGHTRVALGVDSENVNACQFYERLGMACVRQFDEYRKTLAR